MPMKILLALLAVFIITPVQGDVVVFEDVQVITLNGDEILSGQSVLVRDGHIEQIAPRRDLSPPDGATIIAGRGRYLMPGLAEMHAHIPNSSNRQAMEEVLTLYLSQGITTVRGMLGEPGHLTARDDQLAGRLDAPRILAGGPSLNGNSVRSPDHGISLVDAQHEAGYDHLKIHPGLNRAEFDAIAHRARALGMKFAGHVSADYGALHALSQGQTCIDHLDGFISALVPPDSPGADLPAQFFGINLAPHADTAGIDALAKAVDEADAWVVPTETLMVSLAGPEDSDALLEQPGMDYVSRATRNNWRQSRENMVNNPGFDPKVAETWLALRRDLIQALHRHGQRVLLGSDAPQVFNVPGFSIHRELAIYVEAGLSPRDALATGSINVARYLGQTDSRGRIAPGYAADLVLLEANPLAHINHTRTVAGVMVAGRWYDRGWLDERLENIRKRHAD